MKLLRVKASHFKNCQDDTVIDLVAKSKKTTEDKEYELQEIAEGLFVYSIGAFVGKNASGKTTALELLLPAPNRNTPQSFQAKECHPPTFALPFRLVAMIFWASLVWRTSTIPLRESN